jgi:hypothetical protein
MPKNVAIDNESLLLHRAIEQDKPLCLTFLLRYGGGIDTGFKDNAGLCAADYAKKYQSTDRIQDLLKEDAAFEEMIKKPTQAQLSKAIEIGSYKFYTRLREKGITLNEEHLALAKKNYTKPDKEAGLWLQFFYRMIGRELIEELRFVGPYGSKNCGPISKNGICSIFDKHHVPHDIIKFIIKLVVQK